MKRESGGIIRTALVVGILIASLACSLLGADETPTAESPATDTPAPTPAPVDDVAGDGGCRLNASFVADLTVPDNTELQPGATFTKMWRIGNTGTCDWIPGFQLVFVGGKQMGSLPVVDVSATAAGASADISVDMTAPTTPGTYKSDWRLQSDLGQVFGSTFWALIVVPTPATSTPVPTATPVPPAAPSNLFRSTSTSGWTSLVWADNSTDENGFHILADDTIFASTGPNEAGYGFKYGDFFCGQTVQLTVVAFKGTSWSERSNAIAHTGPLCDPPIVSQGSNVTMAIPSYLDFDGGGVAPYSLDVDMLWQQSGGYRILGMNGMRFANVGIGGDVPSYTGCFVSTRTQPAIYTPTLQNGTRLCFNTTDGNLAGLVVLQIQPDDSLLVSFVTWEGTP